MTHGCRFALGCLAVLLLCGVPEGLVAAGLTPQAGVFLVANEEVHDSRFRGGVILLVQHDFHGSAGLIINRSSRLPLTAVLPESSILAEQGRVLSYGGPVEPQTLLALVRVKGTPPDPADEVLEDVFVMGITVLEDWPDPPQPFPEFRVFTGYAGWAPGQLAAELVRGDWRVLPGDAGAVFDSDPETLRKWLLQPSPGGH